MRRMIFCAVFALLFSGGDVFAQRHILPRPHVRVFAVRRYHFSAPIFLPSYVQVPFQYPGPYSSEYSVQNSFPSIQYVFVGGSSPTRLQLVFKDGTTYFVSDYWRDGDQLHFVTLEEGGTKSVPHTVLFDSLDQQRTKDAATAEGFRFVIRDEPIEEWLEHHAQHDRLGTQKTGKH